MRWDGEFTLLVVRLLSSGALLDAVTPVQLLSWRRALLLDRAPVGSAGNRSRNSSDVVQSLHMRLSRLVSNRYARESSQIIQ